MERGAQCQSPLHEKCLRDPQAGSPSLPLTVLAARTHPPCVPAAPWGATRKGLDDAVSQHRGADLSSVPSSRAPCAKCALGGILWRVESAACREQSGFELVRVAGCVTMGARSWQTT